MILIPATHWISSPPDDHETTDFHHGLLRRQDVQRVRVVGPGADPPRPANGANSGIAWENTHNSKANVEKYGCDPFCFGRSLLLWPYGRGGDRL